MAVNETSAAPEEAGRSSREILQFMTDGEKEMETGKFKNATLVLGFTGSGKTTLTQFITGNDDGLIAEENGEDTGEFTITDKGNSVCRNTLESCTIIPKLYVDRQTKTGVYDLPGFGDTRSAKHDISVTYFIKKVVDSVEAVKLLFAVNYPSVRQGVDRQNFMLMVKNVVNMIKNIEKFEDSMALIVTKVDNQYIFKKGQATLVPDQTIIKNIVKFLEGAKDSLTARMSQTGDTREQSFYRNMINFINILLKKRGEEYTRIGLFRRPNEAGPLSQTALMTSGKADLRKILLDNIHYVPKKDEDFGYTVSADSVNYMHTLISYINEDIALNIRTIGLTIQEHFRSVESESRDIEELLVEFTRGHETLMKIKTGRNLSTLTGDIKDYAKTENIAVPNNCFANLAHYDRFLNFIHDVSGLTASPLQWVQGLNDAVENVDNGRQWLHLLKNVLDKLDKYDVFTGIKENQESADVLKDRINKFEVSGSEDGLLEGLDSFLRQVFKNDYDKEYPGTRSLKKVNIEKWKLLKGFLDFGIDYEWDGTSLIFRGQYLKLSDILKLIQNFMTKHQWGPPNWYLTRSIKIYAWRKVFIDQDYKANLLTELIIMAPTWEAVGSPKIDLDGLRGADYQLSKAADGYESIHAGRHGSDGEEGFKGSEGGMFWGMGQNCINCQGMSISANGGKGGAGQDGGDGAKGKDFYHVSKGDEDGWFVTFVYNTKFTDSVRHGQSGGNGGNGGNGGMGGSKGMVKFDLFGDGSQPKISVVQGRPGNGGAGGVPGLGGASNRIINRVRAILVIPWQRDEVITLPSAKPGSWGSNGASPRDPSPAEGRFSNPTQTLENYMYLLQSKINTTPSKAILRQFLQNLEDYKVDDLKHHVGRRSTGSIKYGEDRVVSSAGQNPSFINQAFLVITAMVRPLLAPVKNVKHWFAGVDQDSPMQFQDIVHIHGIENYPQTSNQIPRIAPQNYQFQKTAENHSQLHVPSNLLLMDYLIRMKNKQLYRNRKAKYQANGDNIGHNLAYRAYAP